MIQHLRDPSQAAVQQVMGQVRCQIRSSISPRRGLIKTVPPCVYVWNSKYLSVPFPGVIEEDLYDSSLAKAARPAIAKRAPSGDSLWSAEDDRAGHVGDPKQGRRRFRRCRMMISSPQPVGAASCVCVLIQTSACPAKRGAKRGGNQAFKPGDFQTMA